MHNGSNHSIRNGNGRKERATDWCKCTGKGTSNGVVTDLDGNFKLIAHNGRNSHSRMSATTRWKSLLKKVPWASNLKKTPKLLTKSWSSVTACKRRVQTGAISSVKAEDMQNRTFTQAEQALQGKTTGVQLLGSAAPGSSPTIRIRGFSSNRSSDPLFVVDGLRTKQHCQHRPERYRKLGSAQGWHRLRSMVQKLVMASYSSPLKKRRMACVKSLMISNFLLRRLAISPKFSMQRNTSIGWRKAVTSVRKKINKYWDGTTDTNWADVSFESSLMQRHNFSFQALTTMVLLLCFTRLRQGQRFL